MSPSLESGARDMVLGTASALGSALRGVRTGLRLLREDPAGAGHLARRQAVIQQEFEEARRLGRWHTEEDKALVREHEERLAGERRAAELRRVGRRGAVGLMVLAWFVPLLWPLAIAGSVAAFPRTSRRLAFTGLGLAAASFLGVTLLIGQVLRGEDPPALPPPAATSLQENAGEELGRAVAERLQRECDYWEMESADGDGPGMLRKGIYSEWGGRPVMVIPRQSWAGLSERERRALAEHVRFERGVRAIHVGRIVPSTRFQGNRIEVEQQVWPRS